MTASRGRRSVLPPFRTKAGKHGTLYLFRIVYRDRDDPASPDFVASKWAYDEAHAEESFDESGDEGWMIVTISRTRESSGPRMAATRDPGRRGEPKHPADLALRSGMREVRISSNVYGGGTSWIAVTSARSRSFKTLRGAVTWGRAALGDANARLEKA
jgi:hypothetical protein